QARIAPQHLVGAVAQTLHDAWSEAFDQHVGLLDRGEARGAACIAADVERQHGAAAISDRVGPAIATLALDAQHLRAHVGEQHGAVRTGANAGELDDAHARERAFALGFSLCGHGEVVAPIPPPRKRQPVGATASLPLRRSAAISRSAPALTLLLPVIATSS